MDFHGLHYCLSAAAAALILFSPTPASIGSFVNLIIKARSWPSPDSDPYTDPCPDQTRQSLGLPGQSRVRLFVYGESCTTHHHLSKRGNNSQPDNPTEAVAQPEKRRGVRAATGQAQTPLTRAVSGHTERKHQVQIHNA